VFALEAIVLRNPQNLLVYLPLAWWLFDLAQSLSQVFFFSARRKQLDDDKTHIPQMIDRLNEFWRFQPVAMEN
jgi:hypothetical protein